MRDITIDLLKNAPAFAHVRTRELRLLARHAFDCVVPDGTTVCRAGERVAECFVVVSGRLGSYGPGSLVDLTVGHHPETLTATGPTRVLSFERRTFALIHQLLGVENTDQAPSRASRPARTLGRSSRLREVPLTCGNAPNLARSSMSVPRTCPEPRAPSRAPNGTWSVRQN
jgi:hypothetical protein